MTLEMTLGIVALVLVPTIAALCAFRAFPRVSRPAQAQGHGRIARVLDVAIREWGALLPALVVLLAGYSTTVAVEWVAGRGAHALQGSVDWPVFRWTQAHQTTGWTDVWWKLTQIGSPTVTQWLVVVGAVLLALVWRKSIWWLPGAALVAGYVLEKYGQIILKLVVHRGHPPTTLGTWPSGGCARVLVIYGLITYFLVRHYRGGRSRPAWTTAAALVWLALTIQAYARLNNLEHWLTDVIGGILYGSLLLTLLVAATEIVLRARSVKRGGMSVTADGREQHLGRAESLGSADRAVAGQG